MPPPVCHVVHLLYRFDTGGLENVVVQLINQLPRGEFRHTVVAITDASESFSRRIQRPDVEVISLNKANGHPYTLYPAAFRLLRRLKPDVLHSCNLAALEFVPVAALAGVPLRVHAEHGWEMAELGKKSARYQTLRKLLNLFVHAFVAVSAPLYTHLHQTFGIAKKRLHLIPNGVDTAVFRPTQPGDVLPEGFPFIPGQHWVVGMVGRMVPIKNPLLLVDAFLHLVASGASGAERLRLAMVGDGPLTADILERMRAAGLADRLWLPGSRSDVADILRAMDSFVLPSLSEGTSCTMQEAMATGLPIVATDVGGNADLLQHGQCGSLVPSGDMQALAAAILQHHTCDSPNAQAVAAMASAEKNYSLATVIHRYRDLFLNHRGVTP